MPRQNQFAGAVAINAGPRWAGGKWPIFKFVGLFAILMALFYAVTFIPLLERKLLPGLQRLNAKVSVVIMNLFNEGATAAETQIISSRYSVNIAHGCDAIEPAGLFAAAVLAFPVAFRRKAIGLAVGISTLLVLNLVRIISLYYTGVYWPAAFETMHIDVWQPAFVLLSLFFWIVWALWATKPATPRTAAAE